VDTLIDWNFCEIDDTIPGEPRFYSDSSRMNTGTINISFFQEQNDAFGTKIAYKNFFGDGMDGCLPVDIGGLQPSQRQQHIAV
jgi:hypothetical protein